MRRSSGIGERTPATRYAHRSRPGTSVRAAPRHGSPRPPPGSALPISHQPPASAGSSRPRRSACPQRLGGVVPCQLGGARLAPIRPEIDVDDERRDARLLVDPDIDDRSGDDLHLQKSSNEISSRRSAAPLIDSFPRSLVRFPPGDLRQRPEFDCMTGISWPSRPPGHPIVAIYVTFSGLAEIAVSHLILPSPSLGPPPIPWRGGPRPDRRGIHGRSHSDHRPDGTRGGPRWECSSARSRRRARRRDA